MSYKLPTLVLASTSPRRRQILESLGVPFTVINPQVEEISPGTTTVNTLTLLNSMAKAKAALARCQNASSLAIGADTLVVQKDRILGKPSGVESAREMLENLSGKAHSVVTGLTLLSASGCFQTTVSTQVTFRSLAPGEIESYLKTKEPYDKAGSYAIQGLGSLFVERVEGSYTNVVGLPIEALLEGLGKCGNVPVTEWFRE